MEDTTTGVNTPENRFSTGVINATIWKNKAIDKDGKNVEYRTVSFERRYASKTGDWKTTSSLRVQDLPMAALVLREAFRYIALKQKRVAG